MILVGEDRADYFLLSKSGFDDDIKALASECNDIYLITSNNFLRNNYILYTS